MITTARITDMTDADLRRMILIQRRRFRKARSMKLRLALIASHTALLTELRSRNLAIAPTRP